MIKSQADLKLTSNKSRSCVLERSLAQVQVPFSFTMTEFIDVDTYRYEIDLVTPVRIDLSETIHIDLTDDDPDLPSFSSSSRLHKVEPPQYVSNNHESIS